MEAAMGTNCTYCTRPRLSVGAWLTRVTSCRVVKPSIWKDRSLSTCLTMAGASSPVPSWSTSWKLRRSMPCSPSWLVRMSLTTISSLNRSTRTWKQTGMNSLYETMPSPLTSTLKSSRLMSLRVRPSSAAMRQSLNSRRLSMPLLSASALRKTRSMSASSSGFVRPCSSMSSTSLRTRSSTLDIMLRACSLALMPCRISTMTGKNSLYWITSSSFSSASAKICRTCLSFKLRLALRSTFANSCLSR
mmetsp:Transcript_25971/g.56606  ORF Transcript_25971/g.56606 Transcript_25971/m.56606 type:complete len:246 (-) Transcript_25971:461-1198(-)